MTKPSVDKEGFLRSLDDWSTDVAEQLADTAGISLAEEHWLVLDTLRLFYAETDISPAMRPFVKLVRTQVSEDLGSSIALMKLFGESPAKTASKIAGLPKPTNCI
ncbi:MAG: TusE/DsrC/DsvC family sulfur relay protein [Pseudomonadales bacterium]|nr:TusE/DsrC/DsvC family sulfur relay protein [Pseudomonadales bacterium]